MKKIALLTFCLSLLSQLNAMEKDDQTIVPQADCQIWSELLPELQTEILKQYVYLLVNHRKSFNLLKKEIVELKCVNKKNNLEIDNYFTEEFIINLVFKINEDSDNPISFYQLAKILLTKNSFNKYFDKHKERADKLGIKLKDKITRDVTAECLSKIKLLITNGANVDIRQDVNSFPQTPLEMGVLFLNLPLLKIIIDGGANLEAESFFGNIILASMSIFTAQNRLSPQNLEFDIVKTVYRKLIAKGININSKNQAGQSALLLASCLAPSSDLLQFFLDEGAEINIQETIRGHSPLMEAIMSRHASKENQLKKIKLLLDAGANQSLRDCNGRSAYDYVCYGNFPFVLSACNVELKELLASYLTINDICQSLSNGKCNII